MIPRFGPSATIALFLLCSAFVPVQTTAESFPSPGRNEEISLLGIPTRRDPAVDDLSERSASRALKIEVDGPRRLRLPVGTDGWDIRWFRVTPGLYAVDFTADRISILPPGIGVSSVVEVTPGSITVAPFRAELTSEGEETVVRIAAADEEDRQKAAMRLALFVDFPEWRGRDFVGFGSLRPNLEHETELYTTEFTTDPPESEIFLDDEFVGTAPLTLSLPGGKHRLLVRSPGYEESVKYFRLEGDATIPTVLLPVETGGQGESGEDDAVAYRTIVGPFRALGEADEQLASLFADTIQISLEEDSRLAVFADPVPWTRLGSLDHPDFAALDEAGADLVATGFFAVDDNQVVVQANLYDVQGETVKAGVTWRGEVGFDLFDAMDEVAWAFMEEVDRVLPDAGKTLIVRSETIYGGLTDTEQRITRKRVINRRWTDRPHTLSFQTGIGGLFETFDVGAPDNYSRMEGPFIPLILDWNRDIGNLWAAGAGFMVIPWSKRFLADSSGGQTEPYVDLALYGGPRIVFRGLRSDILFGIDLMLRWSPEVTYRWNAGANSAEVGSFLYLELPVEMAVRYYFGERIDKPPIFLSARLMISPLVYRIDLSGRTSNALQGMDLFIVLGVGVRL